MKKKITSILLICAITFTLTARAFIANADTVNNSLFIVENDFNDDGLFNSGDLVCLAQLLLGKINEVPGESADINGDDAINLHDLLGTKKLLAIDPIWDLDNAKDNIVVANNGNSDKPLWFKETGNTALLETTVSRLDTKDNTVGTRQTQPLVGIAVSDGTNAGYIGIRANNVIVCNVWYEKVLSKDYFATWADAASKVADIDFLIKDNKIQMFIDGVAVFEACVSDVAPGVADDAALSIGLISDSFGDAASLQFADIAFSTDSADVNKYNNLGYGLAEYVFVNGTIKKSSVSNWDLSNVNNGEVKATNSIGSKQKPIYFGETGKTMHLSAHVEATADSGDNLGVGIMMTDGIKDMYICTHDNRILFAPYAGGIIYYEGAGTTFADNPLSPSQGVTEADFDFTFAGDVLTITVNGSQSVSMNAYALGIPLNKDWAFGLVARNDNTDKFDITFSDIEYTTDNELGLFTEKVSIGTTAENSEISNWDLSNVSKNTVRTTSDIGGKHKPLYFVGTGKAMHLSTHVTVSSDSHSTVGAGIYMSNGTKKLYICTNTNKILYLQANSGGAYYYSKQWATEPLSPEDGGPTEVDFDFMLVNDVLVFTVNDTQTITMSLSELDGLPLNNNWAFGLVARADNTNKFDVTFSDIEFTADADEVADEVEERYSLGSGLTECAFVNGKKCTSALSDWDITDIENGNVRAASELGYSDQPLYFTETGKTMLLSTHVTVTDTTQGRPIAAVYISDGSKGTWVGVRNDLYHSHATNGGLYAPANLGQEWFSPANGGPKEADIDFVLENGTVTVIVKGANVTKSASVTLADLGLPTDKNLAFGLFARRGTLNSKPVLLDMTYSNINFTTDANAVAEYLGK